MDLAHQPRQSGRPNILVRRFVNNYLAMISLDSELLAACTVCSVIYPLTQVPYTSHHNQPTAICTGRKRELRSPRKHEH